MNGSFVEVGNIYRVTGNFNLTDFRESRHPVYEFMPQEESEDIILRRGGSIPLTGIGASKIKILRIIEDKALIEIIYPQYSREILLAINGHFEIPRTKVILVDKEKLTEAVQQDDLHFERNERNRRVVGTEGGAPAPPARISLEEFNRLAAENEEVNIPGGKRNKRSSKKRRRSSKKRKRNSKKRKITPKKRRRR